MTSDVAAMAFHPLASETWSDSTSFSRARSPLSPASRLRFRMPSSPSNVSSHGLTRGHAVFTPRNKPTASFSQSSTQPFRQGGLAHDELLYSVERDHHINVPSRYQERSGSCQDRQTTKPMSHRRRRSSDHDNLLAIGSWSNQIRDDNWKSTKVNAFDDVTIFDDENLPMHQPAPQDAFDDFVLFPDDTAEDVTTPAEEPSLPPRAPRISRLRTPDIAPLSTDVQFFPCIGRESDEERINETWYLAGRDRVDAQFRDAMTYMAGVNAGSNLPRD